MYAELKMLTGLVISRDRLSNYLIAFANTMDMNCVVSADRFGDLIHELYKMISRDRNIDMY